MAGQPSSISTRDFQAYLQRQSKLCDSRIEDAYMRLSSRYDESQSSSSAGLKRRTLSSSSIRQRLVPDTVARPSSARERRSIDHKTVEKPRGILRKTTSSVGYSGPKPTSSRESPDEWMQRIMHVKKLSPLDLCDLFSYGDARRHALVSLSHICEVLFDLDPESATGADPVTEEMEEFLYQFATEEGGEILINIREALRALDIWQSRVTSSSAPVIASNLQSKAVSLESKNRKLQDVISNLQSANLRLSRQLDSTKLALSPKSTTQATSPLRRATGRSVSADVSPIKVKATSPIKSRAFSPQNGDVSSSKLQVVNLHEQELVEIASKLQFTGVKRLEELLREDDAESTGFVTLKHLSCLLADEFELKMSETRLIEVCLGMNFNSNAQLDYREFVDVLVDILIYALPDIRESVKKNSLIRLEKYLQSGFPPGREGARQLLDALCSKYDWNNDQIISLAKMVRVFHVDLVKHHALELPFPLKEHETIQLARPFIQNGAQNSSSEMFLAYPELLDAILESIPLDLNPQLNGAKQQKRALRWEFWHSIYMTLCGGNILMKDKVRVQIEKIMAKVDPDTTFTVTTRQFQRIFERHISSDDMDVLITSLAISEDTKDTASEAQSGLKLRYDVLLSLVFGYPEPQDQQFFENFIRKNIVREHARLRVYMTELMTTLGPSHKLMIQDFHEIFIVQAEQYPLVIIEMLFLFASVDSSHDGSVEVQILANFLSRKCWKDHKHRENHDTSIFEAGTMENKESVKNLVAKCCAGYDLQRVLDDLGRNTQGWLPQSVIVQELSKMLVEMGIVGVHQDHLKTLVQNVSQSSSGDRPSAFIHDGIQCDAFFDVLFDWQILSSNMRLPHSLVEVKKVFETFDWEHPGTIRCEDWNKAYRLICGEHQSLAEWEIRVLQRRFPAQSEKELQIDYTRLIVFLLESQQRQARKLLQIRVIQHFTQQFAAAHTTMSTAGMKKLFRALDTDNKGYFNATDLQIYLMKEFARNGDQELHSSYSAALVNNIDAVTSVLRLLAGRSVDDSSGSATIVTFERFREIASSFSAGSRISQRGLQVHPLRGRNGRSSELIPLESDSRTISSLRVLELTILELASQFADSKGNILPVKAFRYLLYGSTAPAARSSRRTSPSSPLRRSTLSNATLRGSGMSIQIQKTQRELQVSTLDPLTPASLQHILHIYHHVHVSRHLISQFFLHLGSPSKFFLDLLHFAQWTAPLSVDLQVKVRVVVRQIIIKGKGGGGRLDFDRFLAQFQRQLADSPPQYLVITENLPLECVSMSLLLSTLHQLNILLQKQEIMALLRHFGMEDDLEAVDYTLFLQRLYELNSSMTS